MKTRTHVDVRCDRHVGEVFPVRCDACVTRTAEYRQLGLIDA